MGYELNPFTRKLDKVGTGGGTGGGIAASLSGNTAGVMAVVSTGTMYLAGGNNVTLSQNANSITISGGAAGGADGINALVVNGGASTNSTTLALSNSNNVSFGLNAGTITASASYSQSTQPVAASASNGVFNFSTLKFVETNGVTWATSTDGIRASVKTDYQSSNANYLTSQSNQAFSASGGSSAFQTLNFANSNGVTFSNSNGSVIASHNGLTQQSTQPVAVSGQNGSFAFSTLSLSNANGVSFGTSAGSAVTASYTVPTVTNSSLTMQAGASTLSSVSRVAFGDGNGVSFGASTSNNGSITITASHNGLTSQSNQAFSASGGSSAFQTLNFANSNGLTFSNSNGSVIGSYTVPTVTDYFSKTNTTFNGANISGSLTLNTNGLQVSLSAAAPGAGGGVAISGGANSQSTGTVNFANSNGITFGLSNNGTMTASHNGITQQSTQPVAASASNGSFNFSTLNFSNANNVTFGTSAGGIVTASVAAPGAAAENNWFALTGANTAGNTTASGSTIGLSGINITLSGTNGSGINISAPATSSLSATGQVSLSTNGSTISIGVPAQITHSRYNEFKESPLVGGEIGNGSLHLQPWLIPNLQFDRVAIHKLFSNASNSSNSFTVSDWVGIYTRNASTLSLLHSTSGNTNFSGSGTAGSYLSYGGGIKAVTLGLTQTLTEGMYWIGVIQRTTTGGGAGHTLNQALNSNINSSYRGLMGAATDATNQMSLGFGVYSATTSAMPASVAFTEIRGNSSVFQRPPSLYFISGTI